jgi:hypothetical protein
MNATIQSDCGIVGPIAMSATTPPAGPRPETEKLFWADNDFHAICFGTPYLAYLARTNKEKGHKPKPSFSSKECEME